jgi:hypothetical protein
MEQNESNLKSLFERLQRIDKCNSNDVNELFKLFIDQISNEKDKLAIIIHSIMITSRFGNLRDDQVDEKRTTPTFKIEQTRNKHFNRIKYNFVYNDRNVPLRLPSVICVNLLKSGRNLDINAKIDKYNSPFLKVNLTEFFSEPPYFFRQREDISTASNEFAVNFKNEVLNPLRFHLRERYAAEGLGSFIIGLVDLPVEIVHRIALNYLSVKSILALARSCTYFWRILCLGNDSVWPKLIKRDFKSYSVDESLSYSSQYKRFYRLKRKNAGLF